MLSNGLEREAAKSRVLVLYAGGTFGMSPDQGDSHLLAPLHNVEATKLVEALQDYGRGEGIYWELTGLTDAEGKPLAPIDSSALAPHHWLWIAQSIQRRYDEFDGFIVIHGTDTLAYTASALSFLLVHLGKPVVVTGSQLPIFNPRTDARHNFLNALWIAGYAAVGLPRITEVVVAFGEHVVRGNRCRKSSTSGWQGFLSPNHPPLGVLGETPRIHAELLREPPTFSQRFSVGQALDDRVADLTLFPGIRVDQIEALLLHTDLRGMILRAYGSGNAPNDPALLACLRNATQAGKVVVIVSQCAEGIVELGRYVSSHALIECGVVSGYDLTPEAALTKLMWLLGSGSDVVSRFHDDLRGEQSFVQQDLPFSGSPQLTLAPPRFLPSQLERALLRLHGLEGLTGLRVELSEGDLAYKSESIAISVNLGDRSSAILDLTQEVRSLLPGERPWRLRLSTPEGDDLRLAGSRLVLVSRR